MRLVITAALLERIEAQALGQYPEETAGLLLGHIEAPDRRVVDLLPLANTFEQSQRARRYLIEPQAMIQAEQQADALNLEILGVYHSHPDHPAQPSEFDRRWAWPWFAYLITSVERDQAVDHRGWLLDDDRSKFNEIPLQLERTQEVS